MGTGGVGTRVLFPILGEAFSLSPLSMVLAVGFAQTPFIHLRKFTPIPNEVWDGGGGGGGGYHSILLANPFSLSPQLPE